MIPRRHQRYSVLTSSRVEKMANTQSIPILMWEMKGESPRASAFVLWKKYNEIPIRATADTPSANRSKSLTNSLRAKGQIEAVRIGIVRRGSFILRSWSARPRSSVKGIHNSWTMNPSTRKSNILFFSTCWNFSRMLPSYIQAARRTNWAKLTTGLDIGSPRANK